MHDILYQGVDYPVTNKKTNIWLFFYCYVNRVVKYGIQIKDEVAISHEMCWHFYLET